MGIIVAPILTNMYMAMLENEFKMKCKTDPKLIWLVLFKRFIDDGFGITKGVREDVIYWIEHLNKLRKTVKLTNIIGETHSIIWIFLSTKVMLFIRMGNSQSLFIKKRQINSCTSLTDPIIKDTQSRTMFGES